MALTANTPLSLTTALESDLEPFSKLRKFDIRNVSLLFICLFLCWAACISTIQSWWRLVLCSVWPLFGHSATVAVAHSRSGCIKYGEDGMCAMVEGGKRHLWCLHLTLCCAFRFIRLPYPISVSASLTRLLFLWKGNVGIEMWLESLRLRLDVDGSCGRRARGNSGNMLS